MTSHTHRQQLARRLADTTDLTYQQALEHVRAAADAGILPDHLDEPGMARALTILRDRHHVPGPQATAAGAPAAESEERAPAAGRREGPRVLTITHSDIGRCPKLSLSPRHYRDDGTCRCNERADAERELAEAKANLAAAKAAVAAAKDHLEAT